MLSPENEYLYKDYVRRMKKYLPGQEYMPRRVFRELMVDATNLIEGTEKLEKYFELLLAQLLQGMEGAVDAVSDSGEPVRSDSSDNS